MGTYLQYTACSLQVTPGNQLKNVNKRKLWALYFSFLEFMPEILCHEDSWLTICASRSIALKEVRGGVSALYGAILKVWFSPSAYNFKITGMPLDGIASFAPGSRIFAHIAGFLADEGALHAVWKCMGAAGIKLCCECLNTVNAKWYRSNNIAADSRDPDQPTLRYAAFSLRLRMNA